jgi:hypothetical protein
MWKKKFGVLTLLLSCICIFAFSTLKHNSETSVKTNLATASYNAETLSRNRSSQYYVAGQPEISPLADYDEIEGGGEIAGIDILTQSAQDYIRYSNAYILTLSENGTSTNINLPDFKIT